MAIAVVYRPPAMTAEQYKESWVGGAPVSPPQGLIFHAGIGEGAEFTTITVWESRAAYDAFAPPQILPVHHLLPPTGAS